MASNTATAYGLPNPRIVDPYPIEGQLLKDTPSPLAMALLYRSDRQAASDQYQNELSQQHDQVRQQLAATMANNAAERAVGAMAHPGGVAYLASQPEFSWMGLGGNQTGLQTYTGPDQIKQMGEASKPGSEAAKNLGEAGFTPATGDVSNITGLTVNPSVPISVQAATARAQGTQDTQGDTIQVIAGNLDGKPYPVPVKRYFGDTPEAFKQRADAQVAAARAANPRLRPLDGGTVTPSTGTTTQPDTSTQAQPGDYTLPPGTGETPAQSRAIVSGRVPTPPAAQQDTPAAAPAATPPTTPPKGATSLTANPQAQPAGNTTTGQLVIDPKIQSKVQAAFRTLPDAVKIDVLAEMKASPNGANLPIYPAKGGGLVLKGRSQFYPVQVTP